MLGSINTTGRTRYGLSQPVGTRVYRYGKQVECELCETVKRCIDRYGLVTCERCQTEFLPSYHSLYLG